ncbi:hypothetical protein SMC26_10690 [Actinomadura fulvescens]|uniref:ATP-dependent DNA helicase RecG n=1 Tax=Actinomadura fulvescens TaxID=46160 RepID=A0ABP6CBR3_9ACTN
MTRLLAAFAVPLLLATLVGVPAPPARSAVTTGPPGGCDPIAPAECLLPFPNDWYTRADSTSGTGRRVAFGRDVIPRPLLGGPVDPAPWNRADGFSPGSALIAQVPGIDLTVTGAAPVTDIGRSLRADAPIVILDAATGERWPHWAELDANAPRDDRRALLIRPARNFLDGHRYVVALRGLKDSAGRTIPPSAAFAKVAGADLGETDPLYERQRRLRPALARLAEAGIDRGSLTLAWDFTVASTRGLTGDLHAIRDDAFRRLGDRAPSVLITKVTDVAPEADPRVGREVEGVVAVPSYLDTPGGLPGSRFHRDANGRPSRLLANTQAAAFRCEIPRRAFTEPSSPALYGHGLLGSRNEVGAGNVKAMAAEHNFTFCATDWIGMAQEDIPNVVSALLDPGRFVTIPERTQQGMLNALFLGRSLTHAKDGLVTQKAFRTADGRPLIDPGQGLVFDGNSQGGILGGALVAASDDIRRGVLGVTAMNYSLLLNRSSDFPVYGRILDVSQPDKLRQQILLGLFQMLWDRGETNGYANHLTDKHEVLMHIAYGDHQVANVAADVQARTIGARLVEPAVVPGRSPDRVPYWGITPAGGLPYSGSAMVVWDSGTPSPPTTNTPPTQGEDPHSDPRNMPEARRQKAVFLRTGQVIDVCEAAPCKADPS